MTGRAVRSVRITGLGNREPGLGTRDQRDERRRREGSPHDDAVPPFTRLLVPGSWSLVAQKLYCSRVVIIRPISGTPTKLRTFLSRRFVPLIESRTPFETGKSQLTFASSTAFTGTGS
jgi:hypothetical protein